MTVNERIELLAQQTQSNLVTYQGNVFDIPVGLKLKEYIIVNLFNMTLLSNSL